MLRPQRYALPPLSIRAVDRPRLLWISLLPFSPPHALAKCVVLLCDRLIACEVAAGPPLFASFLPVQLALFVAVGVLLASARATESLFFF